MSEILESTFVLAVCDLAASKRFYLEKLQFVEDFSVDGWAFLSRGACQLRLGHCPDAIPMSKFPDHSWFAYLHVSDAAGFYRECCERGVEIWHSLADKPWGMREFAIVSPDGHRIVFGEQLSEF
jgi:catechol 2,3-dioxygenase-like lactoylglutathione lyase family enzyme